MPPRRNERLARGALHVTTAGWFLFALDWFRNVENVEPLRAANNAVAVTAAALYACALLTGGRSWQGIVLGRFFGLTAFGWTLVHLASTLALQRYYPFWTWYVEHWAAMLAAVAAFVSFLWLVRRSRVSSGRSAGRARIALLAPAAYALALAHILLVSGTEWFRWFLIDPASWPPLALGAFLFLLVALLARPTERVGAPRA